MDRGAWWATAHWVARVRHDIVTKPPPPLVKQALVKQEMYIKQENSHPGWSEHAKQNSIKKKKKGVLENFQKLALINPTFNTPEPQHDSEFSYPECWCKTPAGMHRHQALSYTSRHFHQDLR